MDVSCARLATLPTCMLADRPVRPVRPSAGTPHKGAMRGNSINSTTMTGAPITAMLPAVRAAAHSGGLPTGMCAITSDVSSPHTASKMPAAVSRLCEYKKCVSNVNRLKKNTTNASRRARSSSVLSASMTTTSVMPAS